MLFKVQIDRSQPQYFISTEVDKNTPWRQVSSGTHMVQNQFVHLEDHMCNKFHASPIFLKNRQLYSHNSHLGNFTKTKVELNYQGPICTYVLSFVKIGLLLRKLKIWSNACFTHHVTATILNVLNFQFLNGHMHIYIIR